MIALSAETTRLHDMGVDAVRVGFVVDGVRRGHPWPALALVVSLEANFLFTFVMIGRNRQAVFRQITR